MRMTDTTRPSSGDPERPRRRGRRRRGSRPAGKAQQGGRRRNPAAAGGAGSKGGITAKSSNGPEDKDEKKDEKKNSGRNRNRKGRGRGKGGRGGSRSGSAHKQNQRTPRRAQYADSTMETRDETSAGGLVVSGMAEAVAPNGHVDLSRIYVALIGRLDRRGRLLWSMPKGHVEPGEHQWLSLIHI